MSKELIEEVAKFLGAAIAGGIIAALPVIRHKIVDLLTRKKEEFLPPSFIAKSQEITELLTELRVHFSADRVRIFNFQNGELFAPNNPCWRITNTYEVCHPGVSHEQGHIQKVLASSWLDVIHPVLSGEGGVRGVKILSGPNTIYSSLKGVQRNVVLFEVDKMPDSACRQTLFRQGVRYALMSNLHKNGKAFGFLSISFVHDLSDIDKLTEKLNLFVDFSDRIQYALLNNETQ